MSTIARRLRKLEADSEGAGRTLVVFSGGASEAEVAAMLATDHGIRIGRTDQLIHFQTIYEDEDGNPAPNPRPPHYMPTALHRGMR